MTELACADDTAPPKSKAQWLATFYLCIPTGYAAGYLAGRYTLNNLLPDASQMLGQVLALMNWPNILLHLARPRASNVATCTSLMKKPTVLGRVCHCAKHSALWHGADRFSIFVQHHSLVTQHMASAGCFTFSLA